MTDLKIIEEAFPLQGDFAQDAKYTWPSRWEAVKNDLAHVPEVDAYKWTALSERMPERYHHVIVAFQMYPGYKLMVCQDTVAWDGHRWCVGSSDVRYQGDVTHWMPLPEAPRSPLDAYGCGNGERCVREDCVLSGKCMKRLPPQSHRSSTKGE